MSKKKVGLISNKGGQRKGAGRPKGTTKTKISVSVDSVILEKSLKKWRGKTSPLIENLLNDYLK